MGSLTLPSPQGAVAGTGTLFPIAAATFAVAAEPRSCTAHIESVGIGLKLPLALKRAQKAARAGGGKGEMEGKGHTSEYGKEESGDFHLLWSL